MKRVAVQLTSVIVGVMAGLWFDSMWVTMVVTFLVSMALLFAGLIYLDREMPPALWWRSYRNRRDLRKGLAKMRVVRR